MSNVFNTAITGLNDAATRIANATANIVNASSISSLPKIASNYSGFTPQDVVSVSAPAGGVITETAPRSPAYNAIYDPNAPQANAEGLVASPNVDLATEAVNAKIAQTSYSADAALIKTEQKTQKALLDIFS